LEKVSESDSTAGRTNTSKWNARYAYANKDLPPPCSLLLESGTLLPVSGNALDLACGRGGDAFHLAKAGLSVTAWDSSQTAIDWIIEHQARYAAQLNLTAQVRNVVDEPPEALSFDVIVVSRFLHRPMSTAISNALRPNGVLIYQTFTAGLSNPDYLLKSGELPLLFSSLEKLVFRETAVNTAGFSEAMFVGRKPDSE